MVVVEIGNRIQKNEIVDNICMHIATFKVYQSLPLSEVTNRELI